MSLKNENQLRIWNGKVPKTPVQILEVTTEPKNITAGESLTFIIKLNRYVGNFTLADIDFMAPPTLAGWFTNGRLEFFPNNTWKLTYDISADFDESLLDGDYNLYIAIRKGSLDL